MAKATFGAGCFWGVEAAFQNLEGVSATAVGYAGGTVPDPGYDLVCTGRTGHAEVVHIEYDPETIPFSVLLDVFWKCHDPTTLNRQGPDAGTQYRSAIFFHDSEQEATARSSQKALDANGRFADPIVTEIAPAGEFYRGEEYHQRYLEKRGLTQCHD